MDLFIYCAGGFGKEIFDTATRANKFHGKWETISFIDDDKNIGSEFYRTSVFTFEQVLEQFDLDNIEVTIANGEPFVRKLLFDKLKERHVRLATLVDPSAVISDTAQLGEGVIVTTHCSVASSAIVGENVAINVKSIVGHDIKVGPHAVISSLVNLGGACTVGESSYIGMGAQIKEGLAIGRDAIVGMGSIVHQDVPDNMIALGNPARVMRENVDKRVFKKRAI